ncbi:DNA-binding response regulator [Eikenella longinqua]|uniref:DNA-binding response regulator n=1 Tax=Eikenella longinqua TaxID=1795827 RepID=A0A1A9S2L7_9NEIS|nr:response regulator transcription factor [Eikenella longinqua]OAM31132.1 DNA-binding response regulator [Eikenella longinqua]
MSNEDIRILLVDDHPLFRRGLSFLLAQEYGFEIAAETADGLEGVKLARVCRPDLVLLDVEMPVMNGPEALAQMLDFQPDLPVLMLTISEDAANLQKCLELGARGYILKNADTDFLVDAIRAAVAGRQTVSPEMAARGQSLPPEHSAVLEALTQRERDVLRYVAEGISNKLIARRVFVSENTVKAHMQNIFRKLNVDNRVQAAVYARELGLDKGE